jgi:hypothetical protein
MTARKISELLENIWLPNGLGEVMVSLSFHFWLSHSKPRIKQRNARTVVYQGEGFPRFQGRPPLTLSGNRSVVKIRPR